MLQKRNAQGQFVEMTQTEKEQFAIDLGVVRMFNGTQPDATGNIVMPMANVAMTGSYSDLTDKPVIPPATTIVNNLTAGGTTSALSAEQGKMLKTSVDAKVDRTSVVPGTAMTTRTTTDADDGGVFTASSAVTVTVHSGAKTGFGFYISGAGAVTFADASGVTVTDKRTTGATNPSCALVQIGTNAYEVIGAKA